MNITPPLRLAVGSHQAGSGKGCAMNVVSWETGEKTISDMPACADPLLARVVQRINDTYCDHRAGDFLCPPCSIEVLALAHRTVGTALDWSAADRASLYAKLARQDADSVAHLRNDAAAAANASDAYAAAANAVAATTANAYAAANAAANAVAAATANAYAAANAAANAVAAATAAAANANANANAEAEAANQMQFAHSLVDRFEKLTGIKGTPVDEKSAARAISQMCEVRS